MVDLVQTKISGKTTHVDLRVEGDTLAVTLPPYGSVLGY